MSISLDLQQNAPSAMTGGANVNGSLAEYEPFFGYDPKGYYYVQANYVGDRYNEPLKDTDKFLPKLLEVLMTGNAKRSFKGDVNDIQEDFVSLVINTAVAHSQIDEAAGKYKSGQTEIRLLVQSLERSDYNDQVYTRLTDRGLYPSLKKGKDWLSTIQNAELLQSIYDGDGAENIALNNAYALICEFAEITGTCPEYYVRTIRPIFRNFLLNAVVNKNNVEDLFREVFSNNFAYQTTLSNRASAEFYNRVFQNWENLSSSARAFYSQNLLVLQLNEGRWVPYVGDYKDVATNVNLGRFRLNLKKTRGVTIFQYSMPLINTSRHRVLHLPGGNAVPIKNGDSGILRELYNHFYQNTGVQTGGAVGGAVPPFQLPPWEYDGVTYQVAFTQLINNDYDFDYVKLGRELHSAIVTLDDVVRQPSDSTPLEALFPPVSTTVNWKRDATGQYYTEDARGNRTYISSMQGTYCTPGDLACSRFFACILNDNYGEIGRCLKDLTNVNVLENVKGLIRNNRILPDDLIRLLKKFGVRRKYIQHSTYGRIIVPQSFAEWKQYNRLPPEVLSTILQTSVLQDVIRAGIEVLTQNPSILNQNIIPQTQTGDARLQDLKIPLYQVPPRNPARDTIASANIIASTYFPSLPFVAPQVSTYSPAYLGVQPFMVAPPVPLIMSGGNCPLAGSNGVLFNSALAQARKSIRSCSSALKNVFDGILNEMKINGKVLDEEDKSKIYQAISEYERKESTLLETYVHLRAYSWLLRLFNHNNVPCDGGDNTVRLTDIKDRDSMNRFFASEVNRAQQSLQSLVQSRGRLIGELGGRILPDLLRVNAGESASSVIPIDRSTGPLGPTR